jgi:hypothetical protein
MTREPLRSIVTPVFISALLVACASLTDAEFSRLDLTTDRAAYAMGDTVVLTVTNAGSRAWNFVSPEEWACLTTVERLDEDGWVDIVSRDHCNDFRTPLSYLEPGERWSTRLAVEPPLFEPGERYRWRWKTGDDQAPSAVLLPSNEIVIVD